MEYSEALNYYHSLEKFGTRPGLERFAELCNLLGNPQNDFKTVHVAGTNGKGSTCTEMASILTASGYKTGLYTSPFVIEFRERIRYCGDMISENDLIEVTETVKAAINLLNDKGVKITEFEAVTAAAFLFYKIKKCDIVILETGLGGRYDATNIITDPICSIITSISFDHMHILGNTLSEIAYEKSGIIKFRSNVITSINQSYEVLRVIKNTCWDKQATLTIVSNGCFSELKETIYGTDVIYNNQQYRIPFCGYHQLENSSLVFSAIEILRENGYYITDENIRIGLESSFIPARMEIIKKDPLIILDGSHNKGSMDALYNCIVNFLTDKRIIAVMGMMADKDCKNAIADVAPLFDKVISVTPSNKRSMDCNEFSDILKDFGVSTEAIADPVSGIKKAYSELNDYDVMIVCGSLYLASDVRNELLEL